MSYLKSLFFNFLIVFFANHLLPGIDVIMQAKLPHLGGDLLFAIFLGALNSLIYPFLKLLHRRLSWVLQIALLSLVISFGAYATLLLLPVGIVISSIEGYLIPAFVVSLVAFLTNFFEMRAHHHPHASKSHHEPSNHL